MRRKRGDGRWDEIGASRHATRLALCSLRLSIGSYLAFDAAFLSRAGRRAAGVHGRGRKRSLGPRHFLFPFLRQLSHHCRRGNSSRGSVHFWRRLNFWVVDELNLRLRSILAGIPGFQKS